jgi:diguanylate cyclase (GGDEF)-like protein
VENLLLVPLRDTKQRLRGVLGSINMQSEWADGALLECVAGSFLMAMQNARSYRLIQKMGTMDAVTGLKNRNSYQLAIGSYAEENPGTFCCIYADANGLHELNNHLGHAAGDAMLKCIGDTLKEIFGEEDSYRVGGDEFVVFCRNCPEEEVEQKLQQFHDTLGKQDYNVSVGISWLHTDVQIDRLIADAECQMYKAKRQYYQTRGELAKAREMNRKLEKILLEKKDADNFLQIISSYFLGVYVVDLATDSTRAIYVPKYFKDKLEKSGGRFFPAMQMYMVHHVLDTDEASLLEFMNYDTLREKLQSGEPLETIYRKPNGIRVRVRVYPSNQYGEEEQETFWLFEEYRLVPEEDK